MPPVLQDSTFKQLRDFIYEKCGIFIPDTKKYLIETRLAKRIQERNLKGFEDYLYLLSYGNDPNELTSLFDAVTTNETYFFREVQQLDLFIDVLTPKVIEQKGAKNIRVWSAACSTGEEPYNLAMLLAEKKPEVRGEIVGSDLSENVLNSAKKGIYGSYAVRNVPAPYLTRYFKASGQTYELIPAIKNIVRFMNINLLDDKKVKTNSNMDIVFCRNVLIYFDDKAKQKAVSNLYDSLRPGGFLIVGSSESLHSVTRAFKPLILNKVVVYQKV